MFRYKKVIARIFCRCRRDKGSCFPNHEPVVPWAEEIDDIRRFLPVALKIIPGPLAVSRPLANRHGGHFRQSILKIHLGLIIIEAQLLDDFKNLALDLRRQSIKLLLARRRQPVKNIARVTFIKNSVGKQRVKMNIEVQSRTKSLDEGHRPELCGKPVEIFLSGPRFFYAASFDSAGCPSARSSASMFASA